MDSTVTPTSPLASRMLWWMASRMASSPALEKP